MVDFGFGISPSSAIWMDKVDSKKFEALCAIEPDVRRCMSCGSCVAGCSASFHGGMNLRRVILYLQRGMEKQALEMASSCMLCGKCILLCPRGINTRNVILSIQKIYR